MLNKTKAILLLSYFLSAHYYVNCFDKYGSIAHITNKLYINTSFLTNKPNEQTAFIKKNIGFYISKSTEKNPTERKHMPLSNEHSSSDLHRAAFYNDVFSAIKAIKQGVNINTPNSWGETSLRIAAEHSTSQFVALLLQQGALYETVDKKGYTPLDAAIEKNNINTVALLINIIIGNKLKHEIQPSYLDKLKHQLHSFTVKNQNSKNRKVPSIIRLFEKAITLYTQKS